MVLTHAGVAGLNSTPKPLAQAVLEPLRGCRWMHGNCMATYSDGTVYAR